MTFLRSVVSFPMGWVVAAAIVLASVLGLWISTLLSRRSYVTIRRSDETELMVHFLRRIAESLERLAEARESAAARESQSAPAARAADTEIPKPVGMSMFGR